MVTESLILKRSKLTTILQALWMTSMGSLLGILCYGMVTLQFWPFLYFFGLMLLLLLLYVILLLITQTLTPIGTIILSSQGLSIITLLKGTILYNWSEIREFRLTSSFSRSTSTVSLITSSNKNTFISVGDMFQISDPELVTLFRNWQNHFLKNEELKDYQMYRRKAWYCGSHVLALFSTLLFSIITFSFVQLTFFPSSSFSLQNDSNTPILNIMVKSGEDKKTTFKPLPILQSGSFVSATLQGIGNGILEFTYTQGPQKICKHFNKSRCLWDGDSFIFKENGAVEASTNTPHNRNCTVPIKQWNCQ